MTSDDPKDAQRENASADGAMQNAMALHRAGRLDEARRIYAEILTRTPDDPEALHLFGLVAYQLGNLDDAARYIDAAIRHRPTEAKYLSNRGNVAKAAGAFEAAAAFYERAIAADPQFAHARFNLGVLLAEIGRLGDAAAVYADLLRIDPGNADAANNLAMIRHQQGSFDEAAAILTDLARRNPTSAETLANLASVHRASGRSDEAEAAYRAAVKIAPGLAAAWFSLGGLLEDRKRIGPAIEAMERAVALDGNMAEAKASLGHLYRHACAWSDLARLNASLDEKALRSSGDGRHAETPFANVTHCDDPVRNLAVAKSWATHVARAHRPLFVHDSERSRGGDGRIVVGYLSSDISDHATAHLARGLFGAHDRERFRVHLYSYGADDGSAYRRGIAADCDRFADIAALDFASAARQIHADGVDILIDLKGWTHGHRLAICAHRAAPIQAGYLGFPGSTGAAFLDYAIVDRTVVPPGEAGTFTEAPAYLPHCYQVNDCAQEIDAGPARRAEWGLPADAFVLCCFNQSYKITPEVFATWAEILRSLPSAVLWLLDGNPQARANLVAAAEGAGIAPDRLIFARHAPKPHHLRRLQLADLALDTWPCNGHTTTSDALWAGVPVAAVTGRHFASRVSASLLGAVGMAELLAGSPAGYHDLAVRLATSPDELAALRARLWHNRTTMPLFDTAGLVRDLEDLYAAMWERHQRRLPPAMIG